MPFKWLWESYHFCYYCYKIVMTYFTLTFSPLEPGSPLRPGKPGGPWIKRKQINVLIMSIMFLMWNVSHNTLCLILFPFGFVLLEGYRALGFRPSGWHTAVGMGRRAIGCQGRTSSLLSVQPSLHEHIVLGSCIRDSSWSQSLRLSCLAP